jgi:integrase
VLLQEALTRAVKWDLLEKSPMPPEDDRPSRAKVKNAIWTKELFLQAIREVEHPMLRLGVHLAFATSCREGEMLALTRDCIDLETGRITINKALKRVTLESIEHARDGDIIHMFPQLIPGCKSVLVLASTKTSVERDAHLTDQLRDDILSLYAWHDKNKGFYDGYEDNSLLFAQEHGEPVTQNLMSKWFRKFIERNGKDYPSIPFKNIRHSSATYKMRISGNDAPTVAKDTGHADLRVLLETYVQKGSDAEQKALTKKFQNDFYENAPQLDTLLDKLKDNPLFEKLFQNLDAKNRELLLCALIGTTDT